MKYTAGSMHYEFSKVEGLLGKRVRIRAIKQEGSCRLLNGLTATVIAHHPIAPDWLKIDLDPNGITPHRDWTLPADRLVVCEQMNDLPAR